MQISRDLMALNMLKRDNDEVRITKGGTRPVFAKATPRQAGNNLRIFS
jgi:hypothetical protein